MIREQIDYFLNSEKGRNATAVFIENIAEWNHHRKVNGILWDMFKYSTLFQENEGFGGGDYMENKFFIYEHMVNFIDTILEVEAETRHLRHEELKAKLCPNG